MRHIKRETLDQIQNGNTPTEEKIPEKQGSFMSCKNKKCAICKGNSENFDKLITPDEQTIRLVGDLSCDSSNIVYFLVCTSCKLYYIGETCNTVRERLSSHKTTIRSKKDCSLGNHFSNGTCTLENNSIYPIHDTTLPKTFASKFQTQTFSTIFRKAVEGCYISFYNTLEPNGLNMEGHPFTEKNEESILPIITTYGNIATQCYWFKCLCL